MLPELRSAPAGTVTVSTASLVLRGTQIEVTLSVTLPRGHGGLVTIQMPRFGWLGESEPYPARQFPELQILIGGVPVPMENSFTASVGSVDVTEAIRKAGVDPFAIADTPPFVIPTTGGAAALETLERLGAVERFRGDYLAKWTAQRTIKVELKPGSHTISLKYKARPGYTLLSIDQITKPAFLAKYCLSARDIVHVFGHPVATQMFMVRNYSIPLSIDDSPPPSISVAIDLPANEDSPRSLGAFCGADGKAVIGQARNTKSLARTDPKPR